MNIKRQFINFYQKKFDELKKTKIEKPIQGWIKTIRELFCMTTTQFANKLNISQPRLVYMEQNEKNMKISTIEKIADELNCDFVYALIPRENINNMIYRQAKKKAKNILNRVNTNMYLENQEPQDDTMLNEVIEDLLNKKITRIWDEKK